MTFQVRAIRPPKWNPNAYRVEIVKELNAQGGIISRMYDRTTRTWKNRPKFQIITAIEGPPGPRGSPSTQQAVVEVFTTDERFIWTDLGTRRHPIKARRAKRLAFQTGFKPKTRRRILGSSKGSHFGPLTRPQSVKHPGTKAREFTKEIQKRRGTKLTAALRKAHTRGIRRASGS